MVTDHQCIAERKGNAVIFTCPLCQEYIRVIYDDDTPDYVGGMTAGVNHHGSYNAMQDLNFSSGKTNVR